jgi:uncharacterized protein (TIGR03663 family)
MEIEQTLDGPPSMTAKIEQMPSVAPMMRLIRLDYAMIALGVILVLAGISRFWELGVRALHHDESLHAVYSFYLYDHGNYQHQPLMHGPVLFQLTAFAYWLFGASDVTARLVPALLGLFLVWAPWKFRNWLGTKGALVASTLILISPSLLYYSRFIRHDVFFAAWTIIIIYGMWKYMEQGKPFHLYLMAAGWGLAFSQKEVSFLLAFVFWSFLALVLLLRLAGALGAKVEWRKSREWHLLVMIGGLLLPFTTAVWLFLFGIHPGEVGANSETSVYNLASSWPFNFNIAAYLMVAGFLVLGVVLAHLLWDVRKFLIGAAVFWFIFILFHTTFFTNLYGIGSGIIGALGYWIEQQEVQRGEQPWYYYMLLVPLYEFLPLLISFIGGTILLLRRRNGQIAGPPNSGGEEGHLNARALWPYFNFWWFIAVFVLLSIAGEKMPWLLTHLALPIGMLAGWAMGVFLDRLDWEVTLSRTGIGFAALFLLTLFAFLSLCWLIFTQQWPSPGTDETSLRITIRWLVTMAMLGGAGWSAATISERISGRTALQISLLTLTILGAIITVRYAIIATYIHGDIAQEPLIFVQTSPSVTMMMDNIAAISERTVGGKNLKIGYDNFNSWPFDWYLRDYPNRIFYGEDPQAQADALREAPIILVGKENEEALKPLVSGYIRHEHPLRWWFPEDYKDLTKVYETEADPANPDIASMREVPNEENQSLFNVVGNIRLFAQQPDHSSNFWDFLIEREVKEPLGGENFIVYIKPEVAADVWQYGTDAPLLLEESEANDALPSDVPESVAAADPLGDYASITVEPPASLVVGEFGEFLSPKDMAVLPDGNLAIADSGNHRIVIMSQEGNLISEFGEFGSEEGQFNEPWSIAVAADGTIYVADTWNHRIQHLDQEGKVLNVWGTNGDTGGELGEGGLFYGPRDIAVDEAGNVYVTDTGNKRVQKFDSTGNFLSQFGGSGASPGQFAEPVGIAIAPDGTIYVADTWNLRIQSFTPAGEVLQQYAVSAWAGQNIMNKPYIAVSNERIWLTDPEGYRIIELDLTGTAQRVWGNINNLNLPFGLSHDGQRLWVADSENRRIVGYDVP